MVHNIVLKNSNNITNYDAIQRLNAGDLTYPYLVGLIEGDGWFSITQNGKYLKYEFGIEMSIRDIQLLYKLTKFLGVGTIDIRYKNKLFSCFSIPASYTVTTK
uniref:LAGLIDADG homing endonuclease n=1 Tax=Phanerochaete carnosa TaxID=231932 RepID=A0A895KTE9_9APHY|nr:LAGLIDADG homing endonuclease [Phanerochaete carnosa]QRZ60426.1 LAGLIDADG homing endonuclease [Phanerochaete carnosa]